MYDSGLSLPSHDWAKSQEVELRRLQQWIRPGYVPLNEAQILRLERVPSPTDAVEEYLRAVDEYEYHGEPELSDEMLVLAAQCSDVSSDIWLKIQEYVTSIDLDLLRRLLREITGE